MCRSEPILFSYSVRFLVLVSQMKVVAGFWRRYILLVMTAHAGTAAGIPAPAPVISGRISQEECGAAFAGARRPTFTDSGGSANRQQSGWRSRNSRKRKGKSRLAVVLFGNIHGKFISSGLTLEMDRMYLYEISAKLGPRPTPTYATPVLPGDAYSCIAHSRLWQITGVSVNGKVSHCSAYLRAVQKKKMQNT